MKENEAIEVLKNNYPKTCKMVNGRYQGGFDNKECDFGQALTTAISALKEIQQYRKIGTVEECREAVEKQRTKKILSFKGGLLYEDGWRYKCPSCGCAVGENVCHPDVTKDFEYCSMCGQKITE